jgi:hypothetical protein
MQYRHTLPCLTCFVGTVLSLVQIYVCLFFFWYSIYMEFRYINVPRNTQRESRSENNRIAKYRCNEHIYEVSDVLLNTYLVSEIIFILTAVVDRVPKKKEAHIYLN